MTTHVALNLVTLKNLQSEGADQECLRATILDAFRLGDIDPNQAFHFAGEVGIELALS